MLTLSLLALVIDWAALASIFTALSVIVTAFLANKRRNTIAGSQETQLDANSSKLSQIHVLVNSRLTKALERIAALEDALGIAKGAPVPTEVSNESKATTG